MQERNGKSLVHEIAGDISKLLKTKMKAVKVNIKEVKRSNIIYAFIIVIFLTWAEM